MSTPIRHMLLAGVVGSQAYGLSTRSSDTDMLACFAYDTDVVLGLKSERESIVTTGPDITRHEAKKFANLALNCNPTVLELLWLNDYSVKEQLGEDLIAIRTAFLSRRRVKDAYMGYASGQFKKYLNTAFREQAEKYTRHMLRLMHQGYGLYVASYLNIKLDDPEWYFEMSKQLANDPEALRQYINRMSQAFVEAERRSPLPAEPDTDTVNTWLLDVRKTYWR